jgi:hypothetical protein
MVLVSDLHLTDERVARNVNPEAFQAGSLWAYPSGPA